MKNYLFILFCTLSSCSTQNFFEYTEYRRDPGSHNNDVNNKEILSLFSKISEKTDHIIYLFVPPCELYSEKYNGMVYDVDNNIYYKVTNPSGNVQDLEVIKIDGFNKSNYCQFIISTYLKDKNYLKWLYDNNMSVGEIGVNTLYDIDLKEKRAQRHEFGTILFIDGLPYLETPDANYEFSKGTVKPYKPE